MTDSENRSPTSQDASWLQDSTSPLSADFLASAPEGWDLPSVIGLDFLSLSRRPEQGGDEEPNEQAASELNRMVLFFTVLFLMGC